MKTIQKVGGIEPITPEDLAEYLRIDFFDKKEMLGLIRQGREAAENYTRVNFVEKTYEVYFDSAVSFFVVPFSNVNKLLKATLNKKDGTSEDVTEHYRFYKTKSEILQISEFDTSEIDFNEGLVFEIEAGIPVAEIPEFVIGAIRWYAINTYQKVPAIEWYEAFKNLLRPIRLVTA